MNSEKVQIEIARADTVMLQVALEERLKTWARTRDYWEQVESVGFERAWTEGDVEECSSLYEAQAMCELWEGFNAGVFRQLGEG